MGFSLVGATAAESAVGWTALREWVERGYAAEMHYFASRLAAYEHPRFVLDGVRSLLMLGWNYRGDEPQAAPAGTGRVARYAQATVDYHDLIHDRLHQLVAFLQTMRPGARARGVVDSAPLMEREFAQRAGLGWIGKNTLLLNRDFGSWFFLAAVLTDVELTYDAPFAADHCGTCRACLEACPTKAFPEPYVLDARRCISYLTIEHRQDVPVEFRAQLDGWVFGCDVCQDVCPWNRRVPVQTDVEWLAHERLNPLALIELFSWDDQQFRAHFRATPLWRTRRKGLLRNAALVLGQQRPPEAFSALLLGLSDAEPLVRVASAWAIGQYATATARDALQQRLPLESEPSVRDEIAMILTKIVIPR